MMTRVLHICPDFDNTRLYRNLFNELSSSCSNMVYVPGSKSELDKPLYPVFYYGSHWGLFDRVIYYRKQKKITNELIRIINNNGKPDIIHAHQLFSAGYAAYKLHKKFKVPYIVAIRNTDVNVFFKMPHVRFLADRIIRNASTVVFLSPAYQTFVLQKYVKKKLRDNVWKKSIVIPNGIDDIFLENNAKKAKKMISENGIKLLYVGEINSNKNLKTTILACEKLIEKGYDVSFTIAGEIKEPKLEKIIQRPFVVYKGKLNKYEVKSLMQGMDIFVMPSIHETFGLVYIESMSQGVPVIYSKGQGIDGYFKDGEVGYAVKKRNSEEIMNRILDIRENYAQLSNMATIKAKLFSWPIIAERYCQLYNTLLNN